VEAVAGVGEEVEEGDEAGDDRDGSEGEAGWG